MGEVYRAHDLRLHREVALKVLPEALAANPSALRRFKREARAVASLSHPNILTIFDFGVHEETAFSVTELLDGETLERRLAHTSLSWEHAVAIGVKIADGLAAAHEKNITHRDVKPANIFLKADGEVVLLDFGLASQSSEKNVKYRASLESTQLANGLQVAAGTPGFIAPEQLKGGEADPRSDIFALGCVLYEMVSGNRAFIGDTLLEVAARTLGTEAVSFEQLDVNAPSELERVVFHCLEKEPARRFQAVKDLRFALQSLSGSQAVDTSASTVRPRSRLTSILVATAIVIVAVTGWLGFTQLSTGGAFLRPAEQRVLSLAVLPMENLSALAEDEYLADGMTELLITNLAQIGALRTISRTSVMQYRRSDLAIREIAKRLGVDAVVKGSVMHDVDQITITAHLIHGSTERLLWADSFDGEMSDLLGVQRHVARLIAGEVQVQLTPDEELYLVHRPSYSKKAVEAYLKANYLLNQRTEASLAQSLVHYQEAIDSEVLYAASYAGLADAYNLLANYGYMPPHEARIRAKEAAREALAIDETLAPAHVALAVIAHEYEWNWTGSRSAYERAIEFSPSYANGRHWFAVSLATTADFEMALKQIRIARTLDPMSLIIRANEGWIHYFARRYDRATEVFRNTLELDPDFSVAHYYLGLALVQQQRYSEAIDSMHRAVELTQGSTYAVSGLGYAYGAAGRQRDGESVLAELHERAQQGYVSPVAFTLVTLGLGRYEEALEWLERCEAERKGWLVHLAVEPLLDPLRDHPSFEALRGRMNLAKIEHPGYATDR